MVVPRFGIGGRGRGEKQSVAYMHNDNLNPQNNFYSLNLQEWLKTNCTKDNTMCHRLPWKTLFPYIVRSIWLSRNNLIFNHKPFNPIQTLNQAIQHASEYHFSTPQLTTINNSTIIHVSWQKPPPSFHKLNIDGSAFNGLIGSGGVIQDDHGRHVTSFYKFVGKGHALLAELWALQIGIKLAKDCQIENLVIETNAILVKDLLCNSLNNINHKYYIVTQNCRSLLMSFRSWRIRHSYREGNKCADALANKGRETKADLTIFTSPPAIIRHLLLADILDIGDDHYVSNAITNT
ncbi:reverse transcriptase [Senna tora]|uniref:Reverse transcriptase n=1 Tax=Senna tora TaxID=362788 RepID=A0A834TPH6_9FABA|nr:reverse transcriptase [Senna tora]